MTTETEQKHIKQAIPALLGVFIVVTLLQQAFSIVSPVLAADFDISISVVSLQVTMCLVVLGVCSVIFGALSDFISIRKLYSIGFCIFGIGSIIGYFCQFSFYSVVVGRLLQTMGQASFGSLYLVLVSRYMPNREKVKYFALFTGAFQLSQVIGVFSGGFVTTYIHWSALFVIPLIIFAGMPIVIKKLPTNTIVQGRKIDICGIGLISMTILLVIFYLDFKQWMLLVLAVACLISFIIYINKNEKAFITADYFKNKPYIWAVIIEFLLFSVQFVFPFIYSFIINGVFGETLDMVSYVLLPSYCIAALFAVFVVAGITKALNNFWATLVGASFIIIGLFLTGIFMPFGLWAMSMTAILFSVGYAIIYSPMVDTIVETLPPKNVGTGIGLNDMVITISGSLGITIVSGLMTNLNTVEGNTTNAIFQGFQLIFMGLATVIVLAIVLLFLKRKIIYQNRK
ncbi:MAG: MFS transporter [Lachnospiraceae bacterium]